jgi:hypothetical protein
MIKLTVEKQSTLYKDENWSFYLRTFLNPSNML